MTVLATLRAGVLSVAVLACARAESRPANPASHSAAAPSASPAATDSTSRLADRGRTLGDPSATLWVVMISDFQCPYCKQWHDESFATVRDAYVKTGKVRLAFLNLPLSMHPNARPAAEAAMCASAQGRFWEMHDALFVEQARWAAAADPSSVLDSIATASGVDASRMRACVKSGAVAALVDQDVHRANAAGTAATPSFVIGDQLVKGAVPVAELRAAIDAALAKAPPARR